MFAAPVFFGYMPLVRQTIPANNNPLEPIIAYDESLHAHKKKCNSRTLVRTEGGEIYARKLYTDHPVIVCYEKDAPQLALTSQQIKEAIKVLLSTDHVFTLEMDKTSEGAKTFSSQTLKQDKTILSSCFNATFHNCYISFEQNELFTNRAAAIDVLRQLAGLPPAPKKRALQEASASHRHPGGPASYLG